MASVSLSAMNGDVSLPFFKSMSAHSGGHWMKSDKHLAHLLLRPIYGNLGECSMLLIVQHGIAFSVMNNSGNALYIAGINYHQSPLLHLNLLKLIHNLNESLPVDK
jgi:hypothetical protein